MAPLQPIVPQCLYMCVDFCLLKPITNAMLVLAMFVCLFSYQWTPTFNTCVQNDHQHDQTCYLLLKGIGITALNQFRIKQATHRDSLNDHYLFKITTLPHWNRRLQRPCLRLAARLTVFRDRVLPIIVGQHTSCGGYTSEVTLGGLVAALHAEPLGYPNLGTL